MEEIFAKAVVNLGVSGAAILAIYLIVKQYSKNDQDNKIAFVNFVKEHNDKTAEIMAESVASIRESTKQNAIVTEHLETHAERDGIVVDLLKEVRDHFVKHH